MKLVEVILVAWVFRKLDVLQKHANSMSDMHLGAWWKICLGFITPLVLGYMMIDSLIHDIKTQYDGYTWGFLAIGIGAAVLAIVIGILISLSKWKQDQVVKEEVQREVS